MWKLLGGQQHNSSTKVDLIMVSIFLPLNVVGIYTIIMNITEAFLGFSVHKRGEHYEWLLNQNIMYLILT